MDGSSVEGCQPLGSQEYGSYQYGVWGDSDEGLSRLKHEGVWGSNHYGVSGLRHEGWRGLRITLMRIPAQGATFNRPIPERVTRTLSSYNIT